MSNEISVEISSKSPDPLLSGSNTKPDSGSGSGSGSGHKGLTNNVKDRKYTVDLLVNILLYGVALPLFLLIMLVIWLFCGRGGFKKVEKWADDNQEATKKNDKVDQNKTKSTIIKKALEFSKTADEVADRFKFVRNRLVVYVLILLILNLTIPELKSKMVLGSELWKWTLLATLVVCGYSVTSLGTKPILQLLEYRYNMVYKLNKNGKYWAEGLRVSVNLLVYSLAVLITWVFYFMTDHGIRRNRHTRVIFHVGTCTFATLVIGAVLWMAKNVMLLLWKLDVVYNRFGERILSAAFQIYFLSLILGSKDEKLAICKPRRTLQEQFLKDEEEASKAKLEGDKSDDNDEANEPEEPERNEEKDNKPDQEPEKNEEEDNNSEKNLEKMKKATENLEPSIPNKEKEEKARKNRRNERGKFYEGINTYEIKDMTEFMMNIPRVISREDDGTSEVSERCKIIKPRNNACKNISKKKGVTSIDLRKFKLLKDNDDAKLLLWDLRRELLLDKSDKISYENFEKSMVRAHKNCVALGQTLLDAIEVVKVLDKVTTLVLIALVVISWLLLTDIATNKILVLIASPFLAATFVFGDTCKKTFEGIIFSFVNHPFDVGDLCIIDGKMLEVKRMGIFTTRFILISTKEEASYPNSTLATQSIINLKGEPDPNDYVELKLEDGYKTKLIDLEEKITKFFKDDGGKRFEETATMTIEEIGSSVRLKIHYQHVMSIHEASHSQCFERKKKQRSDFLFEIAKYMNETQANVETQPST